MLANRHNHNQLTPTELLSDNRRAIGFVSSYLRFSGASFRLMDGAEVSEAGDASGD